MSKNLKMLLLSASCVCVQCDSGGQVGALFTGALREAQGRSLSRGGAGFEPGSSAGLSLGHNSGFDNLK